MSKSQNLLTAEEGKFWADLTSVANPGTESLSTPPIELSTENEQESVPSPSQSPSPPPLEGLFTEAELPATFAHTDSTTLNDLAQKSMLMSQSYARTASPANSQTYRESKDILQALGLPCVETEGAYEAEALACSLVLNGLADYVASEDTVSSFAQLLQCIPAPV